MVGVGASGIQALPPLAESAKHVYVFQRTPSAIGERGNRPTDDDFAEQLRPGWQKERMENFSGVMIGRPVERDLVDDGWTLHTARLNNPVVERGHDARRHRGPGRSVRLRRDGGAPDAHRRDRRRSRRRGDAQAVLPLWVQAALLPRRVPGRVQQPQRDVGRLPGRRHPDHAAQCDRQRHRVRARLHRVRHRLRGRAHAVRRGAPATPSSGAAASRWRRSGRTASSACTA